MYRNIRISTPTVERPLYRYNSAPRGLARSCNLLGLPSRIKEQSKIGKKNDDSYICVYLSGYTNASLGV